MALAHHDTATAEPRQPNRDGTMLDAALTYAARGIPVFPIRAGDKKPLTAHGFKDASVDERVIRGWWRRWPRANIGIPTGARSGLDVLDVDPRHGGTESLARLTADYGPLPRTVTAETGGGGLHYAFAHDPSAPPLINRSGVPGYPGLDVRTTGGYIVVAPSVHESGERYQWRQDPRDTPSTPMPEWLRQLLQRPSSPAPAPDQRRKSNLNSVGDDAGQYWLERFLADAYPGNRNEKGFSLACQLRDEGLTEGIAEGYMTAYASRVPGEGYTDREALASLHSAYRSPARERARSRSAAPLAIVTRSEIKFEFRSPAPGDGHEACSQYIAELEARVTTLEAELSAARVTIATMNQHEKERQEIAAADMPPAAKLVVTDAVNHCSRDADKEMPFPLENVARRAGVSPATAKKYVSLAAEQVGYELTVRPSGNGKEKCTFIRALPTMGQRRFSDVVIASNAGGKREGAGRKPGKPGECGECGSHNVQTITVTRRTVRITTEYASVDQTCKDCGNREIVDGGSVEIDREPIGEPVTEFKFDETSPHLYDPSNLINPPYSAPDRPCFKCRRTAWLWLGDRWDCQNCPGYHTPVEVLSDDQYQRQYAASDSPSLPVAALSGLWSEPATDRS
jgi:hypothetical protein